MDNCRFACLILLCCLLGKTAHSQPFQYSASAGIVLQLGQPVNRIGILGLFKVSHAHGEGVIGTKVYYNFSNYGPPLKYWEIQPQLTLQGTWGMASNRENPFYYSYLPQRKRRYALGYQFQYYWNTIGAQQSTGTILAQIQKVHIHVENDAFGNLKGRDRFRTGAFRVLYDGGDFLYEIKSVLWTGETRGKALVTCREPSDYPCRWGFKDISKLRFGQYSHGVLAAQVHYALPHHQSLQLGLGIDSEHIRNFFQNKVIHDMYFLPPKWVKTQNLHYPMLDENGMPYLYQPKQKIKKNRFWGQVGLNETGFY